MKTAGKVLAEKLPVVKIPELAISKDVKKPEKIVEDMKPEKKRVLRERKVIKNPEAQKKQSKKRVKAKQADISRRKVRETKAKSVGATAAEHPQRIKNNNDNKSRISPFIRQQCPNCDLTLEEESQVIQKCFNCQTPFVYVCVKCGKLYDRKDSMKIHLDTKCHPRKIHSCQRCKYTTTRYAHMKRHVLRMHNANAGKLSSLIQSTDLPAYNFVSRC